MAYPRNMEWLCRALVGALSVVLALMGGQVSIAPPPPADRTWWVTAFAIAAAVTVVALIGEIFAVRKSEQRREDTNRERQSILVREVIQAARRRRVPRADKTTPEVWLGGWQLEAVVPGAPPFGLSAGSNFTIRIAQDGRILISGDIYGTDGQIAASLYESEFESVGQFVSPYDCNADADAFEIVDGDADPVLQIVRRPGRFVIEAFWRLKDGTAILAEAEKKKFDLVDWNFPHTKLSPIFAYPSTLAPGKRV